jgi:hypothetical protein
MNCEKCLALWAEYGIAVRLADDPDQPGEARTRTAILDEIEAHEAEAHPAKVSIAGSA